MSISQTPKPYTAILIAKTHWDREHSRPFEQLRWHLVHNVVDSLLDVLARDPGYRVFMFDGHALVVEDYLEMRPERTAEIRELVAAGRLAIGPFLVGPDEHIPSGESLIRSLLLGHQLAERYGGVMKVGYNPDAFGHVAQMPQILRGFDIDAAAFMRGVPPEVGKFGTDFLWQAPDGSHVLATHFLYVNAGDLPADADAAVARLQDAVAAMQPKQLPYFVLMHATDGSVPDPRMPALVARANQQLADIDIVQGTLVDYFDRLRPQAAALPTYRGELRRGTYQLILGGVYSSRLYLKQENTRAQTLLEKYAEPLATMAWYGAGDPYPAAFLARAWRKLAENHFHDTICGCSQDAVYDDAMQRYAHCRQIGEQLQQRALKVLARAIDTQAPQVDAGDRPHGRLRPLVVFNPLGGPRSEVVTRRINLPVDAEGGRPRYVVFDPDGMLITSQVRNHRVQEDFYFTDQLTSWGHPYPPGKRVRTFDLSFFAAEVPAFGYRTYYYCELPASRTWHDHPWLTAATRPGSDLQVTAQSLSNALVHVSVNANGSIDVTDRHSGHTYHGLHYLEDEESACGEYHHYRAANPQLLSTLTAGAQVTVVEQGPVMAALDIRHELLLPVGLTDDGHSRRDTLVACPVTTRVSLTAHSRRVDFTTTFENNARDHRLRVRFPTALQAVTVQAESAFHVVDRDVELPDGAGWVEPPVAESPQQTFVSVSDGAAGLTLINQGLAEYAAEPGPDGAVLSLTLLRATGWIGRDFYNTAPYQIATPDAQCLGTHELRYALVVHGGDWQQERVWIDAHRFNAPCVVADALLYPYRFPWQLDGAAGRTADPGYRDEAAPRPLPDAGSLLEVRPEQLVVSAIKQAEDHAALIVRLYNISGERQAATVSLPVAVQSAWIANMLEQPRQELEVEVEVEVERHEQATRASSQIELAVEPHQIVTIRLLLQDEREAGGA